MQRYQTTMFSGNCQRASRGRWCINLRVRSAKAVCVMKREGVYTLEINPKEEIHNHRNLLFAPGFCEYFHGIVGPGVIAIVDVTRRSWSGSMAGWPAGLIPHRPTPYGWERGRASAISHKTTLSDICPGSHRHSNVSARGLSLAMPVSLLENAQPIAELATCIAHCTPSRTATHILPALWVE